MFNEANGGGSHIWEETEGLPFCQRIGYLPQRIFCFFPYHSLQVSTERALQKGSIHHYEITTRITIPSEEQSTIASKKVFSYSRFGGGSPSDRSGR